MSEFKVGDRIKNTNGSEYTVTAVGETHLLVKHQKIGEVFVYKSECTIIPDTIKVELSREDVEDWASCSAYSGPASRLYAACNSTLAKENDE